MVTWCGLTLSVCDWAAKRVHQYMRIDFVCLASADVGCYTVCLGDLCAFRVTNYCSTAVTGVSE